MFKFDFDLDEIDDEFSSSPLGNSHVHDSTESQAAIALQPSQEVSIDTLLDRLPPLISYSPIRIQLSAAGKFLTLIRRDLFDARFQLIAEAEEDQTEPPPQRTIDPDRTLPDKKTCSTALEFLDAPSDLVPGVYEGGLKTWECSLDLVAYLENLEVPDEVLLCGKRVLEVGCGTAIPSCYILHRLLTAGNVTLRPDNKTQIHLQDYNTSVLELVTFPNIFLTWYASPAALPHRRTSEDVESLKVFDPSDPAEIQVTSELKTAFLASLEEYKISLRFFSGSWDTFDILAAGGRYDITLTSETIYRTESLPSLIELLRASSLSPRDDENEDEAGDAMHLSLVAAKLIYFGVGGGVAEFTNAIAGAKKGSVQTVWESNAGVRRVVMKVKWK